MPIRVLRFHHREYDLSERTLSMGVLNVTPDSFSDGGRFFEWTRAVEQGRRLAEEGADILDIGGESTRPGSRPVTEEEELRRVIPVIQALCPKISIPISIDTRKAAVAERALESGAKMVNDISALRFDEGMAEVVSRRKVPVVLMHMRGRPETMQADTRYDDLIGEIRWFFQERIDYAVFSPPRVSKPEPLSRADRTWGDTMRLSPGGKQETAQRSATSDCRPPPPGFRGWG